MTALCTQLGQVVKEYRGSKLCNQLMKKKFTAKKQKSDQLFENLSNFSKFFQFS